MRRLAIFGGTFDPVHWGHLLLAETALAQVPLERVIWVPSLNPPYKQAAAFEHRVEMVQRAIADNPGFAVSPIENCRSRSSYAIDTLIDLSADYPDTRWYWIIGLDAFQTLPRWYRGQELAQLCEWLIAPRLLSGETITQSELICKQVVQKLTKQTFSMHWQLLHIPFIGLSSSLIRNLYCEGRSIRYLVPEPVRVYIDKHGLYKNG
ncbi:nicotinate (nicotinamide) nucleotide adenylyltransferase [Scytonema sp. NUACC21]